MKKTIDRPTFDKIECSRCGQCCEDFYLNVGGPIEMLVAYAKYQTPASEEYKAWVAEKPWRVHQTYDPGWYQHVVHGEAAASLDSMMFYGQLEIHYDEETSKWRARCGYFKRGEDGLGACTVYEQRPAMCADFPYGKPSIGYDDCAWNVELMDYEVVQ